jgi:ABC-2 type transport system permease protein
MSDSVRNIAAIAGKELRSYFASPVAWVIMALFALIFGYFFRVMLEFYLMESMRSQFGASGNVNERVVRPLLSNASVLILFLLPMLTMRAYAEEKRSGTIELLLTSPLRDFEIVLGKFLGAMGMFAALLAVAVVYVSLLFFYGNPEWRPIFTGFMGLLLMGGCFIALGLFLSSTTKNQTVAGAATFVIALLFWIIDWSADTTPGTWGEVLRHLSITQHFEDFAKGVIDTKHLIYYLSFISFGLFLTMRSVDTDRWRG